MRSQVEQLEKDLEFCIYKCGMTNQKIGEFITASEDVGVNCEYLAEEFVFESDTVEEFHRLHLDPEYLKINWRLS